MNLKTLLLYFSLFAVLNAKISSKCVTVPCVRSAANILERIDTEIDPCEGESESFFIQNDS